MALAGMLAACAPVAPPDVAKTRTDSLILGSDPALSGNNNTTPGAPPSGSNADIARDFLELEFNLESGRTLPVFTRFEGPLTVRFAGDVPETAPADLARLMQRLQSEAGLSLTMVDANAALTISFLPRRMLQSNDPNVACFVAPGVSTWPEYRSNRGKDRLDWALLTKRDHMAIFIPSDVSPQEVRDCLHEEVAQSLGSLNDLYRLPDSVFNDDNFHTVLTGFDMLMLRIHYDSDLANGMTQDQVAARLPGILARLNPAGQWPGGGYPQPTPVAWTQAIETALATRGTGQTQVRAAAKAVQIAEQSGWRDGRLAFSLFALGRASLSQSASAAVAAFSRSAQIYRTLPGGQIPAAHVDMQLAALALSQGRSDAALALTDQAIPIVESADNAALLTTLMLIKAEALEMQGQTEAALAVRQQSMPFARYGFGSGDSLNARVAAIAALVPPGFRS
jgi:hypothetical protein